MKGLAHDHRTTIRRDDCAVGNIRSVAASWIEPSGSTRHMEVVVGSCPCSAAQTEIADTGAAAASTTMSLQGALTTPERSPASDRFVPSHRNSRLSSIETIRRCPSAPPTEARRLVRDLDDRLDIACQIHGPDMVGIKVQYPELSVPPARPFAELQAADQALGCSCHVLHSTGVSSPLLLLPLRQPYDPSVTGVPATGKITFSIRPP